MRSLLLLSSLLLLVTMPAPSNAAEPAGLSSVLISGVPHVQQRTDFCGEACAEMWLKKLGKSATQDDVFAQTELDPSLGRGAWTKELAHALKRMGFAVGDVWYESDAAHGQQLVDEQFKALHDDLARGIPSITCGHYSDQPNTTEHFRLVLGYDAASDEVIYHEPAEEKGAYRRMKRELFEKLWLFRPSENGRTIIRLRLEPKDLSSVAHDATRPSVADFAQRVMELKEKTAGKHLTIVVQRPFIVIGDEPPATVHQHGGGTVKWTVDLLRKDFFAHDPEEIIDVWAFKNDASYRRYAWDLFKDRPTTPYGYYLSAQRALIMNIGLGYGTLVHEIVHPYMHANAPECPAWINEGLASLYERPSEDSGHIIGFINWRLPALQRAIRAHSLPTFASVAAMDEEKFYNDDDDHYAQSRYLMLYLQQKGLLRDFIKEFLANKKDDPTGYQALQKVLGNPDMKDFQKKWERYTASLDPSGAKAPKPD